MPRRISVVYIDDNSGDQRLVSEAMKDAETPCQLTIVTSWEEAVRHFSRNAQRTFRPDLILLDLYLNSMDGCELVKHIRSVPELRAVPIIVFGVGPSDPACEKALQSGANDCLTRPLDLESLFDQIGGIVSTWVLHEHRTAQAQTVG
jgi:CheY-like chemotaxis protein